MQKEIRGHELKRGETVYVFEHGEGKVLGLRGFDKTKTDEIYEIEFESNVYKVHSSSCFAVDKMGRRHRRWKLNAAEIELTYEPIKLTFHGNPTLVKYSDAEGDEEHFEEGDILHKDWEGMGIDFPMIISKWLRRLNGVQIPLVNYYTDPVNRWLDNLGG